MSGDIQPFIDLITSEHRDKPKFVATVSLFVQAVADTMQVIKDLPSYFDLDVALGAQLDQVGKWIGQSRQVLIPLSDIYFSFGISGLGFGQGIWKGPFDPIEGFVSLDDETYRMVLYAKIGSNHWDGSIPQMYAILDKVFLPVDVQVVIQDYNDMSFLVGIIGQPLTPIILSLLVHGFFDIKPEGVRIRDYVFPSIFGTPFFGFGPESQNIGGFGHGSWATTGTPLLPGEMIWDGGGTWDSIYIWA